MLSNQTAANSLLVYNMRYSLRPGYRGLLGYAAFHGATGTCIGSPSAPTAKRALVSSSLWRSRHSCGAARLTCGEAGTCRGPPNLPTAELAPEHRSHLRVEVTRLRPPLYSNFRYDHYLDHGSFLPHNARRCLEQLVRQTVRDILPGRQPIVGSWIDNRLRQILATFQTTARRLLDRCYDAGNEAGPSRRPLMDGYLLCWDFHSPKEVSSGQRTLG